ncbi:NADH-quinone oxidoreductase subunit N [Candidatus Poribacteria bacterium]|nr:NADH-quinone oxidoreductase subunit N [Candidatus Poribacteria bacterium]MYB63109.1 NADH-quinone oxidoreductase subunit N [Candidatus Poribacteria bacterium]MYF57048.1 NADH-quinone oxidoreductase subunit N [Candidatus Poribacteria bacterium]MYI94906.1 NADH-quinone oxidoreductase subunit N [Candidatus Poribacteria bacterium]
MPSEINIPEIDWSLIMPSLVIVSTMLIVLIFDLFDAISKRVLGLITIVGTAIALVVSVQLLQAGTNETQFNNMFRIDGYSLFFNIIFLISTILVVLISLSYLGRDDRKQGPYYLLILLATLGMMLMAAGNELIIVFLGLELMSLSLYVLAGYFRDNPASSEAGMKYLLLGAFASAFFLYGIALIYGATGTTSIPGIAENLTAESKSPLLFAGVFLLIVGFGFKVAIVPFHQWAPDVYEGAPTTIAAFISAGPKAAGFAAFLRIFMEALPAITPEWNIVLVVLAMLTMTVGNVIAIAQTNIKRMLAYSSIAHAGYVLIGLAAANKAGTSSAIMYLLIYCVMNIGAFGAVILAKTADGESLTISDYAGLGFKKPLLGMLMSLMLLSLAGFPPTAGFVGKFYIFKSAVEAGHYWLVIVGAINTAIAAFYYLRVVVTMYMREPEDELEFNPYPATLVIGLVLAAIGVLLLGILPSLIVDPVNAIALN